ncbi:MAG: hypothetical protein IPK78_04145 [Rhodospirillales bacterium]|nr:hypothetical protein [Rhodospirillales bacterium]
MPTGELARQFALADARLTMQDDHGLLRQIAQLCADRRQDFFPADERQVAARRDRPPERQDVRRRCVVDDELVAAEDVTAAGVDRSTGNNDAASAAAGDGGRAHARARRTDLLALQLAEDVLGGRSSDRAQHR